MPDFYKQYSFKDTGAPVESLDQFLNIRVGAKLVKDTGDEYQKVSETVYDKANRYFLSNHDIENKFALLHATNIFTNPQYCTAEPVEPYHIVNKEYVDALVASASVDLSGFARIDRANVWEKPQTCNSSPEIRTHLTNKGYVDDRINEIEFDTTSLAKLNIPNTFTAPISITVNGTNPEHVVTKRYVDNVSDNLINNLSGFIRADLPNTYTATQTFQYTIIVPDPKSDFEAANKLYVDDKVKETASALGNYAVLDFENTFAKDQTFSKFAICNNLPTENNHLVNKEYVDFKTADSALPANVATIDTENRWTEAQHFNANCDIPEPVEDFHIANKAYVDNKVSSSSTPEASELVAGIVKIANDPDSDEDNAVPTIGALRIKTETMSASVAHIDRSCTFNEDLNVIKRFKCNADIDATNAILGHITIETTKYNTIDGLAMDIDTHITTEQYYDAKDNYSVKRRTKDLYKPWLSEVVDAKIQSNPNEPYCNALTIDGDGHILVGDRAAVGVVPFIEDSPLYGVGLISQKCIGDDVAPHNAYAIGLRTTDFPYPASNCHAKLNNLDDSIITGAWFNASPFVAPYIRAIKVSGTGSQIDNLPKDKQSSLSIDILRPMVDNKGVIEVSVKHLPNVTKLLTGHVLIEILPNASKSDIIIDGTKDLTVIISGACKSVTTHGCNTVLLDLKVTGNIKSDNISIKGNVVSTSLTVTNGVLDIDADTSLTGILKLVSCYANIAGTVGDIDAKQANVIIAGAVSGSVVLDNTSLLMQSGATISGQVTANFYSRVDDSASPLEKSKVKKDATSAVRSIK